MKENLELQNADQEFVKKIDTVQARKDVNPNLKFVCLKNVLKMENAAVETENAFMVNATTFLHANMKEIAMMMELFATKCLGRRITLFLNLSIFGILHQKVRQK